MTDQQRTIAGRYQVKGLIGRGGMADVYEGYDTRLGRTVAIKILKADLAADSSFEARFRQEAQASARMAHPTIVRVYDAGEEQLQDTNGNPLRRPFIVMEFVRGTLLRDLIHQRQLSVQESVSFTEGVLTALEISHRAGVIHRDIKSANIMITQAGQVKVMDFGIARATTDSSATQAHTSGIVGTAQYFSPEQAKGETVDARTDLYSTGVLLYEMLTGRAPFRGETAVSVAYQHVSEAVTPPSQINPRLSPEIDAVVMRALAKDRNERFQSAEQFREHLLAAYAVSKNYAPPATTSVPVVSDVIAGADTTPITENASLAWSLSDSNQTDTTDSSKVATEVFGFDDLLNAAVAEASPEVSNPYSYDTAPTRTAKFEDTSEPATNPFESIGAEFEPIEPTSSVRRNRKAAKVTTETGTISTIAAKGESQKTRTRSIIWAAASAATVIILGLGVWSIATIGSIRVNVPTSNLSVSVPDVSGQTFEAAQSTLVAAKLLVNKAYEANDAVAPNSVIRIDPPAGTSVLPNTTVTIYVSSGKNLVKVPYLIDTLEADANAALTAAKLTLGSISQQNSPDKPKGTIISSTPAQYMQLPEGTAVDLVVSTGKVTVPSVIQQSVTTAKAQLTGSNVGFTVSVQTQTTCTGTLGQIVTGQSIDPGDADQHQNIILYVDCIGGVTPSQSPSPSQ